MSGDWGCCIIRHAKELKLETRHVQSIFSNAEKTELFYFLLHETNYKSRLTYASVVLRCQHVDCDLTHVLSCPSWYYISLFTALCWGPEDYDEIEIFFVSS